MDNATFDIFAGPLKPQDVLEDLSIREEQVQQLRDAFAAAGINSMDERRAVIESCTVRPVTTIRDLLARDVRLVLRRIEERSLPSKPTSGRVGQPGKRHLDRQALTRSARLTKSFESTF